MKQLINKILEGKQSKRTLSANLKKEMESWSFPKHYTSTNHRIYKNLSLNTHTNGFSNIDSSKFNQFSCLKIHIEIKKGIGQKGNPYRKITITPYDDINLEDRETSLTGTINDNPTARKNLISRAITSRRRINQDVRYFNYINTFAKNNLSRRFSGFHLVTLNRLSNINFYQNSRRREVDPYSAFALFEYKSKEHFVLFIGGCIFISDLIPDGDDRLIAEIDVRDYFNKSGELYQADAVFLDPIKKENTKLKKQMTAQSNKLDAVRKENKRYSKQIIKLSKELLASENEVTRLKNLVSQQTMST